MSEHLDIEAIRARLAAATPGPWYVSPAYVAAHGTEWEVEDKPDASGIWVAHCQNEANAEAIAHAPADIAALLAEVERLQRERSEWCDQADRRLTEYMTQQRDLLAENAALRERLTLTPERIEAAAKAEYEFYNPGGPEFKDCKIRCLYLGASRAALLAAGMTEEALQ